MMKLLLLFSIIYVTCGESTWVSNVDKNPGYILKENVYSGSEYLSGLIYYDRPGCYELIMNNMNGNMIMIDIEDQNNICILNIEQTVIFEPYHEEIQLTKYRNDMINYYMSNVLKNDTYRMQICVNDIPPTDTYVISISLSFNNYTIYNTIFYYAQYMLNSYLFWIFIFFFILISIFFCASKNKIKKIETEIEENKEIEMETITKKDPSVNIPYYSGNTWVQYVPLVDPQHFNHLLKDQLSIENMV